MAAVLPSAMAAASGRRAQLHGRENRPILQVAWPLHLVANGLLGCGHFLVDWNRCEL